MAITIPKPSASQIIRYKEQSDACRADWENVNSFLSSKLKSNPRLGEFGKERDSFDFVYLYFNPSAIINGDIETIYLDDIGLENIVKNSSPSLEAKLQMEEKIKRILRNKISNNQLGFIETSELRMIADYTFVVFSLGRSTLYYSFSGELEKKDNVHIARGGLYVDLSDKFEDPLEMDRVIAFLKKVNAPSSVIEYAKKIPTDCFGTVYNIKGSWAWEFYYVFD